MDKPPAPGMNRQGLGIIIEDPYKDDCDDASSCRHPYQQDVNPFLELLTHPNPAVEALIVDIDIPKSRPFGDVYKRPLFPSHGPPLENLKYMELHSAPFYLLTPRCTNLTHFHLHDLPLMERPTVRYFLFMLDQLQDLEHFTIYRSFPINLELVEMKSLE